METDEASAAVEQLPVLSHEGHSTTLSAELDSATGQNPARCYQCGKCSAGCPMAPEMRLGPQQMIRLVQLDRRERLFSDDSMWLCLTCETCTARCPNGFDPARLVDGLREIAFRSGAENAPRHVRAVHRAFLDQIRTHGRVFELGLVMSYKLRTGALFADMANGAGMFLRGKLKFLPHDIDGLEDVRRIFDACVGEERE